MKTKCLFGGALLGAGLCAGTDSSALAGEFVWGSHGFISVSAYLGGTASDSGGDFALSIAASYGDTAASARGDSAGFSFLASANDVNYSGGYAWTTGYHTFSVTTDLTVHFEWDVTTDGYGFSAGLVRDLSTGDNLFDFAFGDTGDLTVTLLAGRTYYLQQYIGSGPGALVESSFSATIVPLPPSAFAGLVMLAGLGAYKRIRRR